MKLSEVVSPRASANANDGEEELKAASAVVLDASTTSLRSPPVALAREWTSLPKKVRRSRIRRLIDPVATSNRLLGLFLRDCL